MLACGNPGLDIAVKCNIRILTNSCRDGPFCCWGFRSGFALPEKNVHRRAGPGVSPSRDRKEPFRRSATSFSRDRKSELYGFGTSERFGSF